MAAICGQYDVFCLGVCAAYHSQQDKIGGRIDTTSNLEKSDHVDAPFAKSVRLPIVRYPSAGEYAYEYTGEAKTGHKDQAADQEAPVLDNGENAILEENDRELDAEHGQRV